MGKAVPKGIKSKANLLVSRFADKFSSDFVQNKDFIKTLELPFSKKERNFIVSVRVRPLANIRSDPD